MERWLLKASHGLGHTVHETFASREEAEKRAVFLRAQNYEVEAPEKLPETPEEEARVKAQME